MNAASVPRWHRMEGNCLTRNTTPPPCIVRCNCRRMPLLMMPDGFCRAFAAPRRDCGVRQLQDRHDAEGFGGRRMVEGRNNDAEFNREPLPGDEHWRAPL